MKINVIDLDHTLIPYDSFKKYILYFMFSDILRFVKFSFWTLLNYLGIFKKETFYTKIIMCSRKDAKYKKKMIQHAEEAINKFNVNVLEIVKSNTDNDTINILCSASPADYVSIIAKKLSWQYLSSYFDDSSKFIYVKGFGKISELERIYPKNKYYYNFSISDNPEDLDLLKKFNTYILYKGY